MFRSSGKGKRNVTILALILIVSFGLMTVNIKSDKDLNFLESLWVWMISPLQTLVVETVDSVTSGIDHYFFLLGVSEENETLKKEIAELKSRNNDLIETIRRNQRVRGLVDYGEMTKRNAVVASVIGRDATQWSRMIFIDKGTEDGVHKDLSVMTNSGVVGHIIHAAPHSAKVLLIVDSRSSVDALFQVSRVSGVVSGTGETLCQMKYVPLTADVKVGDAVLSSGLGGVYPKGLMIGTVSKVTKKKLGLFQEIMIQPGADMARLEEVLVLLS